MDEPSSIGRAVLLATLLAASGCATLAPELEPPRVELLSVQVSEADLRRQRFDVVLRLTNPNDRAVPVKGLDYQIRLAGRELARGRASQSFTLPARGEADLQAELSTDLLTSGLRMVDWLRDSPPALDYELTGRLHTGRLFGAIPFSERGKVPLD